MINTINERHAIETLAECAREVVDAFNGSKRNIEDRAQSLLDLNKALTLYDAKVDWRTAFQGGGVKE